MSFNLEKCEMMQLAGKIPEDRPTIEFAGGNITWVKEFKYLGIPVHQGRRRRLPAPRPKMWKAYFRILPGLSSRKGLPLLRQIQLMQATIMNVALYASPVRDMDYADIDRFTTRVLAQISGCNMRTTSATYMRAELGVLPAKFMAHIRALVQLWHIINEAWFRNLLPHLCGLGPYERLLKIAKEYGIDPAQARSMTRDKWKENVKKIIRAAAEEHMAKALEARGLPRPEPQMESRAYVRVGGSRAQYGIQYRWALLRDNHPKLGNVKDTIRDDDDGLPVFLAPIPKEHAYHLCATCRRWHRPYTTNIVEAMRCPILTPQVARQKRQEAIERILQESRLPIEGEEAIPNRVYQYVDNISWPGQTADSIDMLLQTFQRIIQHHKRQERDRRRACTQGDNQ
jgi:2-hydroxychromene-2-carboxylate isomerase